MRPPTPSQPAILRALRAGPLDGAQIRLRLGCYPRKLLRAMAAAGLITLQLDSSRRMAHSITELGRAECPPVNSASAAPRNLPNPANASARGPSPQRRGRGRQSSEHRL